MEIFFTGISLSILLGVETPEFQPEDVNYAKEFLVSVPNDNIVLRMTADPTCATSEIKFVNDQGCSSYSRSGK